MFLAQDNPKQTLFQLLVFLSVPLVKAVLFPINRVHRFRLNFFLKHMHKTVMLDYCKCYMHFGNGIGIAENPTLVRILTLFLAFKHLKLNGQIYQNMSL